MIGALVTLIDGISGLLVILAEAALFFVTVAAITNGVCWLADRCDAKSRARLHAVHRIPLGRCEVNGHIVRREDLQWMGYELGHRCPEHRYVPRQQLLALLAKRRGESKEIA